MSDSQTNQSQFENIYRSEAFKGEKAAYFLRWVVVSLLIPAAVLMLAAGRYVESLPYSFAMIGVAVGYNLLFDRVLQTRHIEQAVD